LVSVKIPVAAGALIGLAGTILGFYLVFIATNFAIHTVKFIVLLISWACFIFFPHCLAHLVVGTFSGIRFAHYSLAKSGMTKLNLGPLKALSPFAVVLSIRIDKNSLSKASRGSRAAMFYSGALASMILPFIPAFASLGRIPVELSAILLAVSVANLVFDLYYSPRVGDISRARK